MNIAVANQVADGCKLQKRRLKLVGATTALLRQDTDATLHGELHES